MGTKFSVANDLKQELVTRAAIVRSGAKSVRPVVSNPQLPLKKKLT